MNHRNARRIGVRTVVGLIMSVGGVAGVVAGARASSAPSVVSTQTVDLHNNTAPVETTCPDASSSYWHFVIAPNDQTYSFESITLKISGVGTATFSGGQIVLNGTQHDNVFVKVPNGRAVTDLDLVGSSAVISPSGGTPVFNLSHTCVCNGQPGSTSPGGGTTATTQPGTTSSTTATTHSGTTSSTTATTHPPTTSAPATTHPATTQPATTHPATTQPATTHPATTLPATTLPATTLPATTTATTTPATTATTTPASTTTATSQSSSTESTTATTKAQSDAPTLPGGSSTTAAPTMPTVPAAPGSLPTTGRDFSILVWVGLFVLAFGLTLLFVNRRPKQV